MRRGMRVGAFLAAVVAVSGLSVAPAYADHAGNALSNPAPNPASTFAETKGGWTFLANFALGPGEAHPLGVDITPFSRGDKRYVLVSSITLGFRIFDVTNPDNPTWMSDYGSSVGCSTSIAESQLDEPGDVFAAASGWENDSTVNQFDSDGVIGEGQVLGDGTLAAIGTDAGGRCHDGEHGGMELVDTSDPAHPTLLALTRQSGENHNTTYDPWNDVLIQSTSDNNAHIDILDLRSCRTQAQGGDAPCRITETRYDFPVGLTLPADPEDGAEDFGCHDISVVDGKWLCAAVTGTVVFDSSHLRDPQGRLTGSPLPCTTVPADQVTADGRMTVADCRMSDEEFADRGLESADLRPIASIHHKMPSDPKTGGYDVSHQAELIRGADVLMVSDEQGGGLTGDGCPGGGIGFFDMRPRTLAKAPRDALGVPQMPFLALENADGEIVRNDNGQPRPAVYLIDRWPPGQDGNPSCTAHNFKQWGSQPRAFIAWYYAGGHVFDWDLDLHQKIPAVRFSSPGYEYLIGEPGLQWSWSTYAYRAQRNDDGTFTYWVANADLNRGVDFMKATLPAPPAPAE